VKQDYEIGYGKPPRGRPFHKGHSGNPRGPRRKDLSSLLIAALNEPVYVTIDGKRRKITKREASKRQIVSRCVPGDARRSSIRPNSDSSSFSSSDRKFCLGRGLMLSISRWAAYAGLIPRHHSGNVWFDPTRPFSLRAWNGSSCPTAAVRANRGGRPRSGVGCSAQRELSHETINRMWVPAQV
jgi:Family of unknown function (DUF5681)